MKSIRMLGLTALALTLSVVLAGCVAAGYVATVFAPPQKVEALHKPASRPTAVVVENYRLPGNWAAIRDTLASQLVLELRKNNVAPMVDSHLVYDLRMMDPKAFRKMTVDEIGRKVGAEQVIYVDLITSSIGTATGGAMVKGDMAALVKMVDAKTGKTLWPAGVEEGYYVEIDIPYGMVNEDNTPGNVYNTLTLSSADRIAKLFYTWTVPE